MALSTSSAGCPLATGNKSELAVGYSTLYGDMVASFAPIKDVFKTRGLRPRGLAQTKQAAAPSSPRRSWTRRPAPSFREGQVDQDSLPPYPVLDAILKHYVEKDDSRDTITSMVFRAPWWIASYRMTDLAEYKRRQGPIGVKIHPKASARTPHAHNEPVRRVGRSWRTFASRWSRMTWPRFG